MTNALNNKGSMLDHPKVCHSLPKPPGGLPPAVKFIELDVNPKFIAEHGDGQIRVRVTDTLSPVLAPIATIFSAGTGVPPADATLPNGIWQDRVWSNLTGPAGEECLTLEVTWPDTTTQNASSCIHYTS
jgi:hypothetical protein